MRSAIENGIVLFAVFGGALAVLLVVKAVAWWLNRWHDQKRAEAAAARAPLLDLRVGPAGPTSPGKSRPPGRGVGPSNRVPGLALPQTYQQQRLDAGMKDAKNSDVWREISLA